jgi:hypothetical protein
MSWTTPWRGANLVVGSVFRLDSQKEMDRGRACDGEHERAACDEGPRSENLAPDVPWREWEGW